MGESLSIPLPIPAPHFCLPGIMSLQVFTRQDAAERDLEAESNRRGVTCISRAAYRAGRAKHAEPNRSEHSRTSAGWQRPTRSATSWAGMTLRSWRSEGGLSVRHRRPAAVRGTVHLTD